jgi:hypothetical protein
VVVAVGGAPTTGPPSLSRGQLLWVAVTSAVVGLTLADALHAGTLASAGLVGVAGIVLGFGLAAAQRLKDPGGSSPRKPS